MRRFLILLLIVIVAGGGAYWWFHRDTAATTQAQGGRGGRRGGGAGAVTPVSVAAATNKDVSVYLDGLGTVQASALVTVHTQVSGQLMEVGFKEGQDVKAGDVLARIDPRTFQATLDQAVGKKQQDDALLANARVDLARYQKLVATSYTSAQTADTQKSLVAQLIAQVAQDQGSIDSARTQLSYTTIKSPVDGRTGIRQVDAGNIVNPSDTTGIVVVTTLQPISVLFTLPQQSLPAVAAAMSNGVAQVLALPQSGTDAIVPQNAGGPAQPTPQATPASAADAASPSDAAPPADPDAGAKPLDTGTLTVLDNQVDPTTGTIKLKASFPNANLTLWPGAFITVRLRVAIDKNAVVIPPVAVQRGPAGAYVYVLNDDKTVTRRPVTVGHEDLTDSVITAGLQTGEQVVIDGASRLTDKARVSVLPPAGSAPATPPPSTAKRTGKRKHGST